MSRGLARTYFRIGVLLLIAAGCLLWATVHEGSGLLSGGGILSVTCILLGGFFFRQSGELRNDRDGG